MKAIILALALCIAFPALADKCKQQTKAGTPCTRNASVNGFCKQHDPQAKRCAGISKSTGKPCTNRPGSSSTFCHFHQPTTAAK